MSASFLTYSSITKKVTMALAGLFLILFLVIHLIINLFLMKGDGGATFNVFAHFMATNILIKIMEIVLISTIIIHIIWGVILQIQNWMARPVRYKVTGNATTSFFSKYMIYTGTVVFIFFVIHFIDFWFKRIGLVENHTLYSSGQYAGEPHFYNIAKDLFTNPLYSSIYIVLILILGFHLNHAFQSAFQTLGIDHTKYTPCIKACATIYAVIITIGFCIIPVYFLLFYK
jgi:succinate dehydrogenase / fumarate reductase, cytochrome b subunit